MELASENGLYLSIPRGCKRELGRESMIGISDKTVSRKHILVELKDESEEVRPEDHSESPCGLSVEVLGTNPICIYHAGKSPGTKNNSERMVFLKRGEKDTIFPGDRISLSLKHPMFFTAKEDRKGNLSPRNLNQGAGASISHNISQSDASKNICSSEDIAANEKAGIAEAVARRQRRAIERRKQQELMLQESAEELHRVQSEQNEQAPKLQDVFKGKEASADFQQEASGNNGDFIKTQDIDPVKEFGFLIEGSEFDQYKHFRQHKGRWIYPYSASPTRSSSEDDLGDTPRHGSRGKKVENDDEEWTGDDEEEMRAVSSAKKSKRSTKLNLRSCDPSTSKMKDASATKKNAYHDNIAKAQREAEAEDETDETLGGFIVNDEEEVLDNNFAEDEEELLDEDDENDDDDDDDEEELNEDEEMDEAEDEDVIREGTKKRQKPMCKYGKSCFRKNPNHLSQFRHV
ncbi:hypothetical protein KP509_31G043100 [Ceratopteris richardii]|nr:hypothetical protein KP509_31G043100 [Ceratopteris richardii]KAH7288788.1 hypothetical protein KP509_31G043100 [Ceratopteris richardii]KAH7288789.1 hypothetical protein KP509_31G043100 [Ceratopteris richardii]